MPRLGDVSRRVLIGRKLRSDRLDQTLLSKRLALPVFASDPLSSIAYATQEILVILSLGGVALLFTTPWIAAGVVALLVVVVASYRQMVHAFPNGGGDFEAATTHLGPAAGLVVGGALLVDYVLVVAVSISAGVDNLVSTFPGLDGHQVALAAGFVVVLAALNLRGVRSSGKAFAAPTYLFVVGILGMVVWGGVRSVVGTRPVAESAGYEIEAQAVGLGGLALALLLLRAFAAGCTALTGVEAIANGVPAFRKPKSRNAASTLLVMGLLSIAMFAGVTWLAMASGVRYADDPCDLVGFDCESRPQRTVIAQVAAAVFGDATVFFFFVQASAVLILLLAANTAFSGFPVLGSVLAQHSYVPRQLHNRGDRLVYSNGILLLAGFAILLVVAFEASVTQLIQLYLVGVFTSFTLGQSGLVRHWNQRLQGPLRDEERARVRRARLVNLVGAAFTGLVLVIVTVTKFTHGAWIVFLAIPLLALLMRAIKVHYDAVGLELDPGESSEVTLPSRVHAIVLVSKAHKPALRALAYARATRPDVLEAVTVSVDLDETRALTDEWDRRGIPVPLKVLESPYREVTRPVIDYVRSIRRASPRDIVTVYVPEYVLGRWWEQLLHNQSAMRLKTRLLFLPGVMVTSVPWQLRSSRQAAERAEVAGGSGGRGGAEEPSRPERTRRPRPPTDRVGPRGGPR
ncbi:MAG TPA: APC family permease [Jiangellales bacterium]|nr:APC family permease [Jiangellales bacterium]